MGPKKRDITSPAEKGENSKKKTKLKQSRIGGCGSSGTEPLPEQKKTLDELFLSKPSLKVLSKLNKNNFLYSARLLLEKEQVIDQLHYPNCWACSSALGIKYNAIKDARVELYDSQLSPQCLVNCLPALYNTDHLKNWVKKDDSYINNLEDALHMIMYRGIALEADYAYLGPYCGYHPYTSFGFIRDYFFVPLHWSDLQMAAAIKISGYLMGTFVCNDDIVDYKAGTIYQLNVGGEETENPTGKHCVMIIGAGKSNGVSFLEIWNTFGPKFGDYGIAFIARNLFEAIHGVNGACIMQVENFIKSGDAPDGFRTLI